MISGDSRYVNSRRSQYMAFRVTCEGSHINDKVLQEGALVELQRSRAMLHSRPFIDCTSQKPSCLSPAGRRVS